MFLKDIHKKLKFPKAALKRWAAGFAVAALLLTLCSPSAYAATVDLSINPSNVTETDIAAGGATITMTLNGGNSWALGDGAVKEAKCNALLDAMSADSQQDQWDKVKTALMDNPAAFAASGNVLTITLPSISSYDIINDQTVTVNIPSSLLANSSDVVSTPSTFTIKAQPEVFVSGSILSTTEADIVRGGRRIVITLNSGTWQDVVNNTSKREALFDCLTAVDQGSEWAKVIYALKAVEPTRTIALSSDGKTVTITLPPVSNYNISTRQTIKLNTLALASLLSTGSSMPLKNSQPSFYINPVVTAASLSGSILSASETNIVNGQINSPDDIKIVLSLADNTWAADLPSAQAKRDLLYDSMIAKTEQTEWAKVIKALKNAPSAITLSTDMKTVTITVPAVADYNISADQTVTVNIPPTLLSNYYQAGSLSFTITADPAVSFSGTIISANENDIINGGKTMVISLTNAIWADDIATNLVKREALIDKLTCADPLWSVVKDAMKAGAVFMRNNDTTLTITLPPVPDFNIASTAYIGLSEITPGDQLIYSDKSGSSIGIPAVSNAITINPVNSQAAALSGNILSDVSEFDIAKGGKVITITLRNASWANDVEERSSQLLSGFIAVSGSEADKEAWNSVISAADVSLINANTVSITLPPAEDFDITDNITVGLTIDASLVTAADADITVSPQFTIYAVSAVLSGTALTSYMDAAAVASGGKTITISLKNASWIPTAVSDPANLQTLLDSFTGSAWTPIEEEILKNPKNVSLKGSQITIKLPKVPGYDESGTISLTIPKELVSGANNDIPAQPSISIGILATASLQVDPISEDDIISGGEMITITLANNTWIPDIVSDSKKIAALMDGFSALSQVDQWNLVQSIVKASALSNNLIRLSDNKTALTIILPPVPGYDIVKDQIIDITVPRSLLTTPSADVKAGSFNITSIKPDNPISLETAMSDSTLSDLLSSISPRNIYLSVPEKPVNSILINHSLLGSSYITIIDVITDDSVSSVTVSSGGIEHTIDQYAVSGNTRTFTVGFDNLEQGDDITITVQDSSGHKLQNDIIKRIVNGRSVYSEISKIPLDGSYSLYRLMTDTKLLNSILQSYSISDLMIGTN